MANQTKAKKKRKPYDSYYSEYRRQADANGINPHTFYSRMKLGWPPEIAATKKTGKRGGDRRSKVYAGQGGF